MPHSLNSWSKIHVRCPKAGGGFVPHRSERFDFGKPLVYPSRIMASDIGHLKWLAFGILAGFGSSFIFSDLLMLPRDLYYLFYFATVAMLFVLYARQTKLEVKLCLRRRLTTTVVLGVVFGALMVQNVMSRPPTEQFSGLYLGWLVIWRGVIYGAIDGLLLTAYPWLVTWRAFGMQNRGLPSRIAFSLVAWLFILAMTTAYHVGYADFRSSKLVQANIGNSIMSVPTLVSANPVGSAIAHAALHVAAVLHSPETELFLPPHGR